ncbi:hypothetical protein SDC9_129889 [bioreactor metagenome]|uniref:CHAD domain-containing protein n=1 Tax=bioreactor metagenome TaxID=1076179 RepID=A0A645D0W5_9ZZZZ
MKSDGFKPELPARKIEKYNASKIIRAIVSALFEFEKAYIALGASDFENYSVYKFRIEARKLLVRLIVFQGAFDPDVLQHHIVFLERLVADTDALRQRALLDEELACIAAAYEEPDIARVQETLAFTLLKLKKQLKIAYRRADYSAGLTALWASVQQLRQNGIENEDALVDAALEKVRLWVRELNDFKKAHIEKPNAVQDQRSMVRSARYALEGMEDMISRRSLKTGAGLKEIQDQFGMLCDLNAHMRTLGAMAKDGPDTALAYLCGICGGIMLILQKNAQKQACAAWKDLKDTFITLEGML